MGSRYYWGKNSVTFPLFLVDLKLKLIHEFCVVICGVWLVVKFDNSDEDGKSELEKTTEGDLGVFVISTLQLCM